MQIVQLNYPVLLFFRFLDNRVGNFFFVKFYQNSRGGNTPSCSFNINAVFPSRASRNRARMELRELILRICDWFILIWSHGLVPRTVHTESFEGQVAGTCPTNSGDQILVPVTRFFDKNG